MTVAVIDIGTNTILLLIAAIRPDGTVVPILHEQRIPRLGKGVDARMVLHADSMRRAVDVLKEFRGLIESHNPDRTVVCGTSAIRDAGNRAEFLRLVSETSGFAVEVLGGEDEALWTYRGAISGIPEIGRATVIDVGGGSTEITVGEIHSLRASVSLDIGSVRLTERHFLHDPPLPREILEARDAVRGFLEETAGFPLRGTTAVAVAGTATTLALLWQGLKRFDVKAVTDVRMPFRAVDHLFRTLSSMPSQMIRDLSDVMEGRADVITAGALILSEVMQHAGFDEVVVSERGVRYGLALREWERGSPAGHG